MGGFEARLDQKSDKIDATNRCKNKSAFGGTGGERVRHHLILCLRLLAEHDRFLVPSKLPAANSGSGSTEGHGANGNLFSMGVLSVVCGFSLKLDAKKHGRRRNKL